jgi:hypothetical protein
MTRRILGYRGTQEDIFQLTDDVPIAFQEKFTVYDKTDESAMLAFFHARRGRRDRFWVKHPSQNFELKSTASSGSSTMLCYPNNSHLQWQGYERIYILMADGDVLTRKVNSVTYSESSNHVSLALNNALDRDITTTNQVLIGRLLLCRFDSDELRMNWKSTVTSDFTVKFHEVVGEYGDA